MIMVLFSGWRNKKFIICIVTVSDCGTNHSIYNASLNFYDSFTLLTVWHGYALLR